MNEQTKFELDTAKRLLALAGDERTRELFRLRRTCDALTIAGIYTAMACLSAGIEYGQ